MAAPTSTPALFVHARAGTVRRFPGDGPLLYVTDGGHYENLGLVELLRHRPALAFCLDGSGDRPDVATTFAQAIQLAYEELGVVVTPERPGGIGAGAAGPPVTAPDPLIGELKERLAQSCVVTSRIVYPDLGPGLPPREGLLFLGKATLTAATPFEVLAHAARNPSFPNDSTADQWFDFAQFDAYHALGRYVGEETLASVRALAIPPARTTGLTISLRTQDGRTLLIDVDTGPVEERV